MTIPELKRSFDSLESHVASILKMPEAQRVRKFQEAWRSIFGRPVESSAAAAYLQVKERESGRAAGSAASKTRKRGRGGAQAGGAALAGAPLDFQLRPGVDGAHGSFPPYISSGFGFYNTVNQEAMFKDCGVQDITPKVPVSIGTNQVQGGGSLIGDALSAIAGRPFTSSSVPSIGKDFQDMWMGREVGPSPGPEQNRLQYR
jgi:hypothetical protein